MRETRVESKITYPEGYDDMDIVLCGWTITGHSKEVKIQWLYCGANKEFSIKKAIRKAGMTDRVVMKIVITPIKKIGVKNPQ